MLILRANPKGGRIIKRGDFPLHQDSEGNFGILIGYTKDDKIICPMSLAEDLAEHFGKIVFSYKQQIAKIKPVIPLKERIAVWLIGRRAVEEYKEDTWI